MAIKTLTSYTVVAVGTNIVETAAFKCSWVRISGYLDSGKSAFFYVWNLMPTVSKSLWKPLSSLYKINGPILHLKMASN